MGKRQREESPRIDERTESLVRRAIEKRVIREGYSEIARDTGVERSQLYRIVNYELNVSPRVAKAFGFEQVIYYRRIP